MTSLNAIAWNVQWCTVDLAPVLSFLLNRLFFLFHFPSMSVFQTIVCLPLIVATTLTSSRYLSKRVYWSLKRTTEIISFWKHLVQIKKFIGVSFYQLCMGLKLYALSLFHIRNGFWLSKTGSFNFLTTQMMCAVTGHTSISSYRSHFKLWLEECICLKASPETFKHIYHHCLLYIREGVAAQWRQSLTLPSLSFLTVIQWHSSFQILLPLVWVRAVHKRRAGERGMCPLKALPVAISR